MSTTTNRFYLDKAAEYLEQGLKAKEKQDAHNARFYLLKASEFLLKAAERSGEPLRSQRIEVAQRLVGLAESLPAQGGAPQAAPSARGERTPTAEGTTPVETWLVHEKPTIKLDDVAGLEQAKEQIRIRMIYPFTHPDMAKHFGIKTGGGILLYGPPGTGKTMLAKAVAGEIDAAFFVVKPSDIMSQWVGIAEQNIAKLFAAAKASDKSIIFIDEVEALVPRRSQSWSTVMQRVVPQMLQEMEGFQSKRGDKALLFMGATNEPWSLDEAILRPGRLDEKVYIPLPEKAARLEIFKANLKDAPLAEGVSLEEAVKATEKYSGADIRHICERASHIPFLESVKTGQVRNIEMRDILTAIQSIKPSVTPKNLERFEKYAQESGAM